MDFCRLNLYNCYYKLFITIFILLILGQEPGYVSGTYMPQQSGGPTGGGGQPPMRLSIQSGVPPPQQGPPQSQPTPTSTPPGAPVDMKPTSHIPGQTQLQQGNIEIGKPIICKFSLDVKLLPTLM